MSIPSDARRGLEPACGSSVQSPNVIGSTDAVWRVNARTIEQAMNAASHAGRPTWMKRAPNASTASHSAMPSPSVVR